MDPTTPILAGFLLKLHDIELVNQAILRKLEEAERNFKYLEGVIRRVNRKEFMNYHPDAPFKIIEFLVKYHDFPLEIATARVQYSMKIDRLYALMTTPCKKKGYDDDHIDCTCAHDYGVLTSIRSMLWAYYC